MAARKRVHKISLVDLEDTIVILEIKGDIKDANEYRNACELLAIPLNEERMVERKTQIEKIANLIA